MHGILLQMDKNTARFRLTPKRVLFALICISLLLFVIHVVLKYISIVVFDEKHGFLFELANRFDMNDESSVPQWFSHMLFLSVGISGFLAGYMQTKPAARKVWYSIGVLGVLLSIDDVATLHEFALQTIHNTFYLNEAPSFFINAWWLILPVLLVPAGLIAYWGWKHLPHKTIYILIAGGLVFVLGKILMDSLANDVTDFFINQGPIQGIEKLFQYLGLSVVLFAILKYLDENHSAKVKQALTQLRGKER